jgi:hypothetical protein
MKRTFLLAAASVAPLILAGAAPAFATDTISSSTTTPVATATATNNAPDDVDIASGGSVTPKASGAAVTLNSNNVVTVEGQIGFTGIDNATGIQVLGGFTGAVTNSGTITVTDGYTPSTDSNTGLNQPPFAQGTGRAGIQVVGPGVFTGSITNTGAITVHGAASYGVDIEAPITGDYQSIKVVIATGATTGSISTGVITILGGEATTAPVVGFHVGSTGGVGGNITLGGVSATGVGAQAVSINGDVGGAINLAGAVTATGYETTSRSNFPSIAAKYAASAMQQGGVAVTIGGNVAGGVIISAPPLDAATNGSTASDLINGQSVPQTIQGTGTITSFGGSPALVVGSATRAIEIGVVGANNTVFGEGGSGAYGLVNQGSIVGNGVFDPILTPNLPSPVSATALQIGSTGGFTAKIDGGFYNTGVVSALAYQASATAVHVTAGGSTPLILNNGVLVANSTQETSSTTGFSPVSVYGVLIEPGATVTSLVNNSGITANLTGTAGVGGRIGGVIDRSGSLASLTNTGTISAQATQTLITAPMPFTATAIDMSQGVGPQTLAQSASTNPVVTGAAAYSATTIYKQGQVVAYNGIVYQAVSAVNAAADPINFPNFWRQIGAQTPFINGSVLLGSGGSVLTVNAGTINGPIINLGTGSNNAITINGPSGALASATSVTGAIEEVSASTAAAQVAGAALLAGGGDRTLTININNGTLNDLNPNTELVNSVNVGANGVLVVAADPSHGVNTKFVVYGNSTFAPGAKVGLSLISIPQTTQQTYTILQTVPGQGTLSVADLSQGLVGTVPWLFNESAAYVPGANPATDSSEIQITVARKSAAELGFNAAEASALDAVLAAAPADDAIQSALLSATTEATLKPVYDQLLPSQGQGLFEALDSAAQQVGAMVGGEAPASSRAPGTSLWLQEVNERVDRTGSQTIGSFSKLFGVVAGYEYAGAGGGAAGVTLAYFNANELNDADRIGSGTVASMVEAGAYYRRAIGRFSVAARAAIGYSWFSGDRVFAYITPGAGANANSATGTERNAHSNWGGLFYDAHFGAAYEQTFARRYYVRPEISADFLELDEDAHSDTGGGPAFDLTIARRHSNRLSGQAIVVLGREWGQGSWLRTEFRGGYREILAGQMGDTTANFDGGSPFTLAAENDRGGWYTAGFSIKGGSLYSYLALEGDIDFRAGEQRYNVRIAGRSIF